MEKKKTNNKRKIVALILLVTFIMLPISGMFIHGAHGEAAGHKWLHIHVLVGVVFMIAGIYHIAYNRQALKRYLTAKK
ncbi:DUF4405 domain-containing protein [Bacteroidales bacterium OttesenSCG-928-I14]|nr:DUF4405 domain-containing protein [Bacteroidales bacterium OttesenSCG-928-I14]